MLVLMRVIISSPIIFSPRLNRSSNKDFEIYTKKSLKNHDADREEAPPSSTIKETPSSTARNASGEQVLSNDVLEIVF
jgi:hypothetical protein